MTTVTAQQTAADLLSAANHIETYGLCKGDWGYAGGPCCINGAIQVAVWGQTAPKLRGYEDAGEQRILRARAAVLSVLPKPRRYNSIAVWNDALERTGEQAAAKLREAAEAVFPND